MRRVRLRQDFSVAATIAIVVILAVTTTRVEATEPSGHVVLEPSWIEDSPATDRRKLRLTVRSLVPLEDWTLAVAAPVAFGIHHRAALDEVEFVNVAAGGSTHTIRAEMQPLAVDGSITLEFEVVLPAEGGGTISLIAERGPRSARRLLGAVGIVARAPGAAPVRRVGAVEFRAAVLPSSTNKQ